jgi:hypothetical protein
MLHFAGPPRMRFRVGLLNAGMFCSEGSSDIGCSEHISRNEYKFCPQVGKWTLGAVWWTYHQECDEFGAPRSTILSGAKRCKLNRIHIGIRQKCLETCDVINEVPKGFTACTHLACAMSGILTIQRVPRIFHRGSLRPRQESQPRQPPRLHRPKGCCRTNIQRAFRFV